MAKEKTFRLRLTAGEVEEVERRAEAAGLTMSAWVRLQLFPETAVRGREPERVAKAGELPFSKWCVPCQRANQIRWNCRECKR